MALVPVDIEVCLHSNSTLQPSVAKELASQAIERLSRPFVPGPLDLSSCDDILGVHVASARVCELRECPTHLAHGGIAASGSRTAPLAVGRQAMRVRDVVANAA